MWDIQEVESVLNSEVSVFLVNRKYFEYTFYGDLSY